MRSKIAAVDWSKTPKTVEGPDYASQHPAEDFDRFYRAMRVLVAAPKVQVAQTVVAEKAKRVECEGRNG